MNNKTEKKIVLVSSQEEYIKMKRLELTGWKIDVQKSPELIQHENSTQ